VPLAKPLVLVALVALAVEVCEIVGEPAVTRFHVRGMVAAPSRKVVCTAGATAAGGMVSVIPDDGATGAAAPVGRVEVNTPELLKVSVPDATVVVAPAGAGIKSADGMVTA
jgi:hypothetical protein